MENFILFSFVKQGQTLLNAPYCGMTVRSAGTMRFRWNESNPNRQLCFDEIQESLGTKKQVCPVELIHSQTVYAVSKPEEIAKLQGDGIITLNKNIIPTITVADCVPIYLYDSEKKVYGIVHSGWKGTGIVQKAIELAGEKYGSKPEDFSVVIGPHIHDCCYIINEGRAEYFRDNFSTECVKPLEEGGSCYCGGRGLSVTWNNGGGKLYRLSLLKANLAVIKKAGVPSDNVNVIDECTCCNQKFGSNRRETAENGRPDCFTVQAAFIIPD